MSFPDLPIDSYLRFFAWGERTAATILADPTLESVARANGVRILDRSIQLLSSLCKAAFHEAAGKEIGKGSSTTAFVVSAPLRLWSAGIENSLRFDEWVRTLRGTIAGSLPTPTRDVLATYGVVSGTAREAYAADAT